MTDILTQILRNEFPIIDGFDPIEIYGRDERVNLNIVRPDLNPEAQLTEQVVLPIVEHIFSDVPYNFGREWTIYGVHFTDASRGDSEYLQRHTTHIIEIDYGWRSLIFWTGNRGNPELGKQQRKNYVAFASKVADLLKFD